MEKKKTNMDPDSSAPTTRFESYKCKARQFFSVNTHMISAKVIYLIYGSAIGSSTPFFNIFFVSVGLSASQAGFITGIRFIGSLLAGPLWGALLDYTGKRSLILVILCLGGSAPIFSLPWVARAINNSAVTCATQNFTNTTCLQLKDENTSNLFYALMGLVTLGTIFFGPLNSWVDLTVMELIKTGRQKSSYGGQVVFCSFGLSLGSYVTGIAAESFQYPSMSPYTVAFLIFLPSLLIVIPIGCYMVRQIEQNRLFTDDPAADNTVGKTTPKRRSMKSQLQSIFFNFDSIFIMVTVLVSGISCTLFFSFALLFAHYEMDPGEANESFLIVVAVTASVIVCPLTSKIIKLLRGTENTIAVGLASYFIRFVGMSYVKSFWLLVVLQLLHGFGFGFCWVSIIEHVHRIAPCEIKDTMFQINNSIHFGLSPLIANIAGGKLYNLYGSRVLFRSEGIICGVWCVIMVAYYSCKHLRGKRADGGKKGENENENRGIDNHANDTADEAGIEF